MGITKKLRARLGDGSDLPDVEEAIAVLAKSQSQAFPVHCQTSQSLIDDHKAKLNDLVTCQRQERQVLNEAQEKRRLADIKASNSRLPTGLKLVWTRSSGFLIQTGGSILDAKPGSILNAD